MPDDVFTEQYAEPLSPNQVENKLRALVSELTRAENVLRDSRDVEVKAIRAYREAQRAAFLSPDCPKVKRDGTTKDERDAWVEERCAVEQFAAAIATATREAAADHLRVVRDQASIVQSLGGLVKTAFSMAGTQ